jgi:hypothetical protein
MKGKQDRIINDKDNVTCHCRRDREEKFCKYFLQMKNIYNERRALFQERGYMINLRLQKKEQRTKNIYFNKYDRTACSLGIHIQIVYTLSNAKGRNNGRKTFQKQNFRKQQKNQHLA